MILENEKNWKDHSTFFIQKTNLACSKRNWNANVGTSAGLWTVVIFLFVFKVTGPAVENVYFNILFSTTRCGSKILYENIVFCFKLHLNLWLIKLQL